MKLRFSLYLILSVFVITLFASEEAHSSKYVSVLTNDNFDNITCAKNSSKGPWIIMFYAPWCPHC